MTYAAKRGPVLASMQPTEEREVVRTNTVTRAAVAVVDARDAGPVTAYSPVSNHPPTSENPSKKNTHRTSS